MLNPGTPKSQCFSAHVAKSNIGGLISFVHWGYALQVTLTLSFGGRGVVPDRKALNISSIYSANWGVRQAAHPSWHRLPLCSSFGLQTLLWKHYSACCWSFSNLRKTLPFRKKCILFVFRLFFFYSLIRNLFQAAENIVFSQVKPTFVLLVPFLPIP